MAYLLVIFALSFIWGIYAGMLRLRLGWTFGQGLLLAASGGMFIGIIATLIRHI